MRRAMVVLVLAATVTLLSTASGTDRNFLQKVESRTASEWQAVWSEERLTLCRARLRHNLDAICGRDIYRRSPVQRRYKRRAPKYNQLQQGTEQKLKERRRSDYPPTNSRIGSQTRPDRRQKGTRRSPFLSVQQANLFVSTWIRGQRNPQSDRRRRQPKSITAECCTTIGCTWEEYAEYCPTSSRARPGIVPI